jgi:hypothetical protein
MVKAYWIAIALAAGLALGLHVGRTQQDAADQADRAAPPAAAPGLASPPPARPDARAPGATDGSADFGGGFQQIKPGTPVPDRVEFADPMDQEFLREQRDDSWAYLREAELENSVVMETGMGNFKKDRIECRASICIVELSATGGQVEALRRWVDERNEQRSFSLDQPLMLRGAAYSSNGNQAEARLVYVNPRSVLPTPRN